MRTIFRHEGESLEQLANRAYTTRWTDGHVDDSRLESAMNAIVEANPDFDSAREVRLPQLDGIPYLDHLVESADQLHEITHELLGSLCENRRLLVLSFIDPLRLGCEELGIAVTPEVAESVRARLAHAVSFDAEVYAAARDGQDPFDGIQLAWRSSTWPANAEASMGLNTFGYNGVFEPRKEIVDKFLAQIYTRNTIRAGAVVRNDEFVTIDLSVPNKRQIVLYLKLGVPTASFAPAATTTKVSWPDRPDRRGATAAGDTVPGHRRSATARNTHNRIRRQGRVRSRDESRKDGARTCVYHAPPEAVWAAASMAATAVGRGTRAVATRAGVRSDRGAARADSACSGDCIAGPRGQSPGAVRALPTR